MKETIHKVNPKNNELAATVTEFEQLENKVLAGLEAETKTKAEYVKAITKGHLRSLSRGLGLTEMNAIIPEDSEPTSRGSAVPRTDFGTSSKKAARANSVLSVMRPKIWRRRSSSMKVDDINGNRPKSLSFSSLAAV